MRKVILPLLALTISLGVSLWLIQGRFFDNINLSVSSWLYQENAPAPSDTVVLVTIDDKTLSDTAGLGKWENFKRSYYARVLDRIEQDGPLAIGVDVLFSEQSDPSEDQTLAATLRKYGNIVLAGFFRSNKVIEPIPELRQAATLGNVYVLPDRDNILRRIPLLSIGKEAMSLVLFRKVLGNSQPVSENMKKQDDALVITQAPVRIGELKIPPAIIPVDEKSQMLLNFFQQGNKSFPKISFVDVYHDTIPQGTFKNKVVLIGADAVGVASGLSDKQFIPLSAGSAIPGVAVHAHALETMLQGKYLQSAPEYHKLLLTIGFVILNTLLFFTLATSAMIGITIAELFLYATIAFFTFSQGILLNIIYPVFGIAFSFIVSLLLKLVLEQKSKRFISKAFSQYVSPQVLQSITKNPESLKLGGEKREISAFFTDIEGFTSISEHRDPAQVVAFLNEYFTEIANIVLANQGTIDKFEGDAVMSFFGAPANDPIHAYHAVRSAVLCQKRLQELQSKWKEADFPPIKTRIGINSGEAVVGNIGSKDHFDYTVIGDTVNLASRLEGVNKFYQTYTVVSEFTRNRVQNHFVFRLLDWIQVKGKTEPVKIYEVIGLKEDVSSKTKVMIEAFEEILAKYLEGDFEFAKKKFYDLNYEYRDPPSQIFVERCEQLLKEKPMKWNGVFTFSSK